MTSLLKFSAIAAPRGEGLHPKLRDLFERVATFPNSEVVRQRHSHRPGVRRFSSRRPSGSDGP